jgi:ornithine lipid ester-linked acyl 2-hydroxylase
MRMLQTGRVEWLRSRYKQYRQSLFFWLDRFLGAQSLVPNDPVLDTALFPWIADLERHWQDVQAELGTLLAYRRHMPLFQEISPDQMRISPDDKWRVFFLYGFGYRVDANCSLCPKTARLLDGVPGIQNAFFSILAAGKIIPQHRGITKGLIRCHLGVVVPPDKTSCYMDVGPVRCTWEEGRALLFDDTFPHSAATRSAWSFSSTSKGLWLFRAGSIGERCSGYSATRPTFR